MLERDSLHGETAQVLQEEYADKRRDYNERRLEEETKEREPNQEAHGRLKGQLGIRTSAGSHIDF